MGTHHLYTFTFTRLVDSVILYVVGENAEGQGGRQYSLKIEISTGTLEEIKNAVEAYYSN